VGGGLGKNGSSSRRRDREKKSSSHLNGGESTEDWTLVPPKIPRGREGRKGIGQWNIDKNPDCEEQGNDLGYPTRAIQERNLGIQESQDPLQELKNVAG